MSDSNPHATFRYVAEKLNGYDLAYVHVIEPRVRGIVDIDAEDSRVWSKDIRRWFNGPLIAAGGFTGASAEKTIAKGGADLVAFGRFFVSNPDLPFRLRRGLPLSPYDRSTFYGGDAGGYTDYPAYDAADQPDRMESVPA